MSKSRLSYLVFGMTGLMAASLRGDLGRLNGYNPTTVIVDEAATIPQPPRLPKSPAEQDGGGLRPNRKARRRDASQNR